MGLSDMLSGAQTCMIFVVSDYKALHLEIRWNLRERSKKMAQSSELIPFRPELGALRFRDYGLSTTLSIRAQLFRPAITFGLDAKDTCCPHLACCLGPRS